jgi:excinuclease ABC subunit C
MNRIPFDPADPKAGLTQLPRVAAVFALYGADPKDEPYIGRTPNLRARLERLLQPSAKHPRRLQLAGRVRRIEWRLTGSEFESLLLQLELLQREHGTKCLERMHLRPPAFVRFFGSNAYPRVAVTHRPSQREAAWTYGPFPSRAAAERYAEEVLKLFLLRRCTDDLNPDPDFPGCVYSEMKMCLAPCYKGCTDARYGEEAAAVQDFFASRGGNRLVTLRTERDEASAALRFESAAALHAQVEKVEAVRALAAELVRPLSELRAVVLQASAKPGEVSVFLFRDGVLRGPAAFSTLGMKIQNEGNRKQGAGTREHETGGDEQEDSNRRSFDFAPLAAADGAALRMTSEQPEMTSGEPGLQELVGEDAVSAPARTSRAELESRLESLIAVLSGPAPSNATLRQGHLALLKRWYYRPEARRVGEIFFPGGEGRWPVKAILRGIGRVAAKSAGASAPPS